MIINEHQNAKIIKFWISTFNFILLYQVDFHPTTAQVKVYTLYILQTRAKSFLKYKNSYFTVGQWYANPVVNFHMF